VQEETAVEEGKVVHPRANDPRAGGEVRVGEEGVVREGL